MTFRGWMMLSVIAALSGCQTAEPMSEVETQAQILSAVPINYRQEAPFFLRSSLADLGNIARAEISQPMLGFLGSQDGVQVPLVCVRLTSLDASGGIPSSQTYALVFRDGRIINSVANATPCSSTAYGPFPELRAPA